MSRFHSMAFMERSRWASKINEGSGAGSDIRNTKAYLIRAVGEYGPG
jgi:hypothetical protein